MNQILKELNQILLEKTKLTFQQAKKIVDPYLIDAMVLKHAEDRILYDENEKYKLIRKFNQKEKEILIDELIIFLKNYWLNMVNVSKDKKEIVKKWGTPKITNMFIDHWIDSWIKNLNDGYLDSLYKKIKIKISSKLEKLSNSKGN